MNKKRGLLLVFLTAIISGFSIFINKFSLASIEPSLFTFLKNLIVGIFLISIIFLAKDFSSIKALTKKQWLKLTSIGLIGGSIPFVLFFKGLSLASAASSGFIHKTLFIFATIFALTLLKEKLNKKIVLAAILLLAGNFLLLKLTSFTFGLGEFLILIATVFWALENVISKHTLKELSGNVVAFGRMFFGSLFILIYLAFTNKLTLISTLSLQSFTWIIITSVFLLLYVITYYNGLKYVKVSTATSILLLGSPITTILALTFTDATLALTQFIGILLILTGIYLTIKFSEFTTSQSHTHNV
jgi:drug/metabolite transporter (DMT)-like permease